jgi:formylglycine-generating enzyme required for sulfatase activity
MRLRLIPAGRFLMGSPPWEEHHSADEGPRHEVHIKNRFYAGVFPVTQGEYEAVTGRNPSRFARGRGGPDHPAAGVTWEAAMAFCAWLSRLPEERRAGRVYQLPTEAEWEYACRAGTETPYAFGATLIPRLANIEGHVGRTTPVGSYPPNGFGLHDMHGNVWEWCNGYYYDEEHYRTAPRPESDLIAGRGPDPRVVRGGCWASKAAKCRSADRYRLTAGAGVANVGFRVVWRLED